MSSMKERIIESISSDFKDIKEFEEGKALRKECSLLTKRIDSAKKLCKDDLDLLSKLELVQKDIDKLLG